MAPFWLDRPAEEAIELASSAEKLGFAEFWVGEMLHFDAFALAGALAASTRRITITTGPLALGLRDPVGLGMGVGSIEVIGGREARLAIGASSPTVVAGWHGRAHGGESEAIEEAISLVRAVLSGEKTDHRGPCYRSRGFRSGLGERSAHITVAAAGPRMVEAARRSADRLVANLVSEEQVGRLVEGSPVPVAVWVVAAVDPDADGLAQVRRQLSLYLRAPGYAESLAVAGMGELVSRAKEGAGPRELTEKMTVDLISAVAAIGSVADATTAIESYERSGADVMLVPVTAGDAGGRRTLTALA